MDRRNLSNFSPPVDHLTSIRLPEVVSEIDEDFYRRYPSLPLNKRYSRPVPVSFMTNLVWAVALIAYTWAVAARARLTVEPCDCESLAEPLPILPSPAEVAANVCHDSIRWAMYVDNMTADRKVRPLVMPGTNMGNMNPSESSSTAEPNSTSVPKNSVIRPIRPPLPSNNNFKFYGWSGTHAEDPPDREAFISFFVDDESTQKYGGTFVEVGAGDGRQHSNSLFFEESLGWNGVLIDADEENGKKLLANTYGRAGSTKKVVAAMCDPKMEGVEARYVGNGSNSGVQSYMSQEHVQLHEKEWGRDWRKRARMVECRTLHSVLERAGIGAVDLMTVDVAGAEKEVLKGANFEKVHVRVIVVAMENETGSTEKAVRALLMERGFCFARRIGRNEFWVGDEVMKRMHCAWAGLRVEP